MFVLFPVYREVFLPMYYELFNSVNPGRVGG